jgi:chromosome segregation ATPase
LAATESNVEVRIARLESDVGKVRSDLADVKQDVRDQSARVDRMRDRIEDRFGDSRQYIDKRFDELRDRMDARDRRI